MDLMSDKMKIFENIEKGIVKIFTTLTPGKYIMHLMFMIFCTGVFAFYLALPIVGVILLMGWIWIILETAYILLFLAE